MNPLRKDSIVDVRCVDGRGRQFLVEMQMMWTPEYKQRVLFNASKAYVSQLDKSRPTSSFSLCTLSIWSTTRSPTALITIMTTV